jgi:hypothetical protein
MIKMKCVFNTINGQNTGAYCRTQTTSQSPVPPGSTNSGILMRKHCPNATFYVDKSDGGNNYYRLIDHQSYAPFANVDANTKVYMYVGSPTSSVNFLSEVDWGVVATPSPQPEQVQTNTQTDTVGTSRNTPGLDAAISAMLQNNMGLDAIKTGTRIIGSPFQFLPSADYRPCEDIPIGRKYMENIIAEAPMVYFIPGIPSYLPDFDKKNKEVIENYISARYKDEEVGQDALDKIMNEEGRYFDFIANYEEYMRYVNMLCRVCAVYIGIGEEKVPGSDTPYKSYDWSRYVNYKNSTQTPTKGIWDAVEKAFSSVEEEIFGDYRYLKCYVDPNASFSESSSNSTDRSQIAGMFESLEPLVREVQFLTGGDGTGAMESVGGIINDARKTIMGTDTLKGASTSNLSRLLGLANHTVTGANVIMPEIWSDSNYQKSYDFTMHFVSPYGDLESIYLNVIMPMMHVLALALPRQTSANSFTSPFLVKVFSKGWFSCEMGMVDSISIEKGGGNGDAWNVHGLPNEATVKISVRDLYPNLMMTKASKPALFFNNQGLIDFLAVTCGVDITQPNLSMKLESIISTYLTSLYDIPSNWYNDIIQSVRNKLMPMFKL